MSLRRDRILHVTIWSRYLLLVLPLKYNLERSLQLSVGSVLGVLSSSRLVLPLWVGSHTLWFDANIIISTGGAKAATFTPLEFKANLFPCGLVYDWAGRFAKRWACGCGSRWIWSVKRLMGYELAVRSPFTACGKLHFAVQIIILHHF